MSTVAVVVVLLGGSAAIAAIPDNNSVDSHSVIDETLKSVDLKDGQAVESSDAVNNSLTAADLAPDSVDRSELAEGAVRASEIVDGEVHAAEIDTGAVTATGAAVDSIGQSEIAAGAVGGIEIREGSVSNDDIADGVLDAGELSDPFYRVTSAGTVFEEVDDARNADYGSEVDTITCNEGRFTTGELVAGYGTWSDDGNPAAGNELVISEVRLNMDNEQVTVIGSSDDGAQGGDSFHTIQAVAICLAY